MYKFGISLLTIAFIFLIAGCGSGRTASLNRKPNEAIIIAKVQIRNGGSFLNKKWNFLLDERLWAKWAVCPDENNYIYMKVPLGKHFIALLQYSNLHKNVPDNYLTFNIKENKIYYIGDIIFNWTIDKKNDATKYNGMGAMGGIIGAMSESKKTGEYIKVNIIDNFDETTKYFNSKFANSEPIEKEFLKVNK
jgi:hypothetical protein